MKKKEREQLEALSERAKGRDYLKGMYGDLFGKSSGTGSKPDSDTADSTASGAGTADSGTADAGKSSGKSGNAGGKTAGSSDGGALDPGRFTDPLLNARRALEEAQKLFGELPDFAKLQSEMPKPPTEKDLLEIDPSVMGDFGFPVNAGKPGETAGASGDAQGQTQQDLPTAVASGGPAPEEQEEKPKEPEKDPMEELDALIGLEKIKKDVRELADFAKIQKLRRDQGMKSVPVSLHLVFTGNPGTGKTTVARILARLYKKIGILSKGQLVEVDRSGLVAGYVGQTALKTQDQIKKAMGGILFIDEAYALAQKDDAFGQEAIDTVLKAMEDHRDDLIVIVAGYTKPMEKFINSNPGLKSRFNKYIEFPDYTVDELEQIFLLNCRKYEYELDEGVQKHIRAMIVERKLERLENFANAREVRNLFEDIITNQARRIAAMEDPKPEDIRRICIEDLTEEDLEALLADDEVPGEETPAAASGEEAPGEAKEETAAEPEEDTAQPAVADPEEEC